eukprot:scaffold162954_cov44-Prasinocladus_malaysianus.AAC.1
MPQPPPHGPMSGWLAARAARSIRGPAAEAETKAATVEDLVCSKSTASWLSSSIQGSCRSNARLNSGVPVPGLSDT